MMDASGSGNTPVTFGRILRKATSGELTFTEAVYAPGTHLPGHAHDRAAMTFTLWGEFSEVLDGVAERCSPLSLLFKPAGMTHCNDYARQGARLLIVEMSNAFVDALGPFAGFGDYALRSGRGVPSALAVRLYRSFATGREALDVDAEELLMEIVTSASLRLAAVVRPVPPWLRRVRDRLHHEHDKALSLSMLATEADVHPVYLARAFRACYRCSIGDYRRARRLDATVEALLAENQSACDIGLSAGFYDQSHFSRTSRRLSAWRRRPSAAWSERLSRAASDLVRRFRSYKPGHGRSARLRPC